MSIKIFHGSNVIVEHPEIKKGRQSLDFGQGFYLTDIRFQATEWAKKISTNRGGDPLINVYTLHRDQIISNYRSKVFTAYDEEWLDFIIRNRQQMPVEDYDYIEGGVANDRIIDTVRLYMLGLIPIDITLKRLIMHKPNNQICIRKQSIIDNYLIYESTEQAE